jgi:hypothetical protein
MSQFLFGDNLKRHSFDRQIDALVYDLFRLTSDEIKIVEGV